MFKPFPGALNPSLPYHVPCGSAPVSSGPLGG
jgi:hypothetical protein